MIATISQPPEQEAIDAEGCKQPCAQRQIDQVVHVRPHFESRTLVYRCIKDRYAVRRPYINAA